MERFAAGSAWEIRNTFFQFAGFAFHAQFLLLPEFVVKPEEMEDAVNQQVQQPALRGLFRVRGFPKGGFHGDHHISQESGLALRVRPIPHGKGYYIGGPRSIQVLEIQFRDGRIVHQDHAEFNGFRGQAV